LPRASEASLRGLLRGVLFEGGGVGESENGLKLTRSWIIDAHISIEVAYPKLIEGLFEKWGIRRTA